MKKLLFAINPHAGKGEIKTKALEVIDLFVHDGYEVTVHTTQRRREITHLLAGRAAYPTRESPPGSIMRCPAD